MTLSAETVRFLSRLVNYVFAIPILIFGMIGSFLIVIIIVHKRTFRQNTSLTYLMAGAIVTGIHLPTIYIQMILVYGFDISLMNTNLDACREFTYLRFMTNVAAISFPCWAAFDQYVATSRHADVRRRWGSLRVVRLVIVSTVIFWVLIFIPMIFNTGIINGVCTVVPGAYSTFSAYVFTPFVHAIGPVAVITFCTLGTVRNLRSNIQQGKTRSKLARQVRAMLIPQLVILAVSGIPFGFQNVYFALTNHMTKEPVRVAWENFGVQLVSVFYHFNYVFTFYIYVYKSSEFRKVLRNLFFRCLRMRPGDPVYYFRNNSVHPLHWNSVNTAHTG